ncbi:transglycosylase SLT domain-containing protein [Actinospongicola halichondriae]|uniref:transglycosylase SLT domain-containing protein n=1 Tax=Actinospongicola halichondriae TaxID=3236844 RepID=UPI003D53312D
MRTISTPSRRVRRLGRGALLGFALVAVSACSPQHWIVTHFDSAGQVDSANRIATCESNMDPSAVSPTNDHGLFQINAIHRADFERVTGQPWSKVYDANYNSMFARWLFDHQGWGPWTCKKVL